MSKQPSNPILAVLCWFAVTTAMLMSFMAAISALASDPRSVFVIGDSISAERNSWPKFLQEDHDYHVRLDAQSLRFGIVYVVPPDLNTNSQSTVVYFLGTNDALLPGGADLFKENLSIHVNTLVTRGFTGSTIPPTNDDLL